MVYSESFSHLHPQALTIEDFKPKESEILRKILAPTEQEILEELEIPVWSK
tara:strand:+ start:70 stop:222 length:153 start_codon:yes stop_codon:yes gene_type:complete